MPSGVTQSWPWDNQIVVKKSVSTDIVIIDNRKIRKVIDVQYKKCRTKTKALKNSELTRYSCEDFPSRTTQSHLLVRKDKIRPNI